MSFPPPPPIISLPLFPNRRSLESDEPPIVSLPSSPQTPQGKDDKFPSATSISSGVANPKRRGPPPANTGNPVTSAMRLLTVKAITMSFQKSCYLYYIC